MTIRKWFIVCVSEATAGDFVLGDVASIGSCGVTLWFALWCDALCSGARHGSVTWLMRAPPDGQSPSDLFRGRLTLYKRDTTLYTFTSWLVFRLPRGECWPLYGLSISIRLSVAGVLNSFCPNPVHAVLLLNLDILCITSVMSAKARFLP